MKRFHELTKQQQEEAIEASSNEVMDLLKSGVVTLDGEVTRDRVREIGTMGAENAFYAEEGDKVFYNIAEGK